MKAFKIYWENCFMQEGVTKILAKTEKAAIKQFEKDFGVDYLIISVGTK